MQERPGKILAAGMNYRDHAAEAGLEVPERPMIFGIWPSSMIGPGEAIVIPSLSSEIDYEAELGVVVGERARAVPVERRPRRRRRLHVLQRRERARPPVPGRAVDAGQVARHVLADGPARHAGLRDPGPAGAQDPLPRQRRGAAGLLDRARWSSPSPS